jgi:hypothetical protein
LNWFTNQLRNILWKAYNLEPEILIRKFEGRLYALFTIEVAKLLASSMETKITYFAQILLFFGDMQPHNKQPCGSNKQHWD